MVRIKGLEPLWQSITVLLRHDLEGHSVKSPFYVCALCLPSITVENHCIESRTETQFRKLVGRCGIDPPLRRDEIYSLAARATSFTYP